MNPITEQDAGCWIDGHWGHYASAKLILIASAYGWQDPTVPLAEQYMNAEITDEEYDELFYGSDAALDYLDTLAPPHYSFGWYDGELFLWCDEDWEYNLAN